MEASIYSHGSFHLQLPSTCTQASIYLQEDENTSSTSIHGSFFPSTATKQNKEQHLRPKKKQANIQLKLEQCMYETRNIKMALHLDVAEIDQHPRVPAEVGEERKLIPRAPAESVGGGWAERDRGSTEQSWYFKTHHKTRTSSNRTTDSLLTAMKVISNCCTRACVVKFVFWGYIPRYTAVYLGTYTNTGVYTRVPGYITEYPGTYSSTRVRTRVPGYVLEYELNTRRALPWG